MFAPRKEKALDEKFIARTFEDGVLPEASVRVFEEKLAPGSADWTLNK
jgi:hypothetical protein